MEQNQTPTPEQVKFQEKIDGKANEILPLLDGLSLSEIKAILGEVENITMLLPLQTKY